MGIKHFTLKKKSIKSLAGEMYRNELSTITFF